jgi:hypothetical protein
VGWHARCLSGGVAILAPIIAFIGQQLGKLLQMAFGWATVLLFGRVPQSKSLLLAGVALGAIAWLVTLIGIVLPAVGAFLLAFVPIPSWVDPLWVRLVMLALAVVLPLLVGLGGYFLLDRASRPQGLGIVRQLLRGYPYSALLALVLIVLLIVAPLWKLRSIAKRWEDAHIPIVVKPGGYDTVAKDIEAAVDAAGLDLNRTNAPWVLELPSKLLAAVGGESVRRLVPQRLIELKAKDLEVTIHPSDVAMAGRREPVARARAAIATRMTFTAAYLTSSQEAQKVEDQLVTIARSDSPLAWRALADVDRRLARLTVPYDEWEVLYRQRLQVECHLRERPRRQHDVDGEDGEQSGLAGVIRSIVRALAG